MNAEPQAQQTVQTQQTPVQTNAPNEPTPDSQNSLPNPTNNPAGDVNSEWLNKLEGIIDKRIDGLAKSILKDNGLEDDEIKDIVAKYKSTKTERQKNQLEEFNTMKAERDKLQKEVLDSKIKEEAGKLSESLSINPSYLKQVIKLADLSKATNNGTVVIEELEKALKDVVDNCEAFKITDTTQRGFRDVGSRDGQSQSDEAMAKIRKAMGLK